MTMTCGLKPIRFATGMGTIMENRQHRMTYRFEHPISNWLLIAIMGTFALPCATAWGGPEVPGKKEEQAILIRGVTVHTISGDIIADGAVTIIDGKIGSVGTTDEIAVPTDARVIEFDDDQPHHLYPGLIDADTALGLVEIEAVRATKDTTETGELNPNAKALTAFNPDSELIPVARAEGVLIGLVVPRGRLLRGQSALMMLDGWTGDDMALEPAAGMHLSWPSPVRGRSWENDDSTDERRKRHRERLEKIGEFFEQAKIYRTARADESVHAKYDPRFDSLVPVIAGEQRLFVHANDVRQIEEAIAFAVEHDLKIVIVGGYDAELCAELLIQHEVPVIVTGTHRLPRNRHAAYDEPFTLPARLKAAGVTYCLSGYDRFSAAGVRNLTQHAGTAAAFGLEPEEAVRAITLAAAEVLGVADRIGSIEKGKDATLIIADGDVLEIHANISHAFIQGRAVDLDNRHKRLYRKYQQKYERLETEP
jgi:imidazolonepropionase-like amidohydrolase